MIFQINNELPDFFNTLHPLWVCFQGISVCFQETVSAPQPRQVRAQRSVAKPPARRTTALGTGTLEGLLYGDGSMGRYPLVN